MKLVIDHLTRYGYDEEVKFSTQYLRLTPRSTARQTITAWTLTLPDGAAVTTTDGWGNVLHVLTLDNPHKEITIRASGIVDIADEGEETRDEEYRPADDHRLDADPAGRRGGDHYRRLGQCAACADAG